MRIRYLIVMIAIVLIFTGCQSVAPLVISPTQALIITRISPPTQTLVATPTLLPSTPTPVKLSEERSLWNDGLHKSARQDIDCKVCHKVNGENITTSIAWWDQENGVYETVADSDALCNKCHQDPEKLGQYVNQMDLPHADSKCLDCHNPHSTTASCTNSGCHANILKGNNFPPATPSDGHQSAGDSACGGPNCHLQATQAALSNPTVHGSGHSQVACIACHAASAVRVERSKETGSWSIVQTARVDEKPLPHSSISHAITRQVVCTRCHFDGNTWNLPLVTGHEFEN